MRIACLQISPDIFLQMCKHGVDKGLDVVKNSLPYDAEFVRIGHDSFPFHGYLNLVLQSDSFKDLKKGDKIPVLESPIFDQKK